MIWSASMVCPNPYLSVTWSCIMHKGSSKGLTDCSIKNLTSDRSSSSFFPLLHSSSFSFSMSFFCFGFLFVTSLSHNLCSTFSLLLLPLCGVCCILNPHCLFSQRASSLCLPILFERLTFSSIKTELSRAKVFSIML